MLEIPSLESVKEVLCLTKTYKINDELIFLVDVWGTLLNKSKSD